MLLPLLADCCTWGKLLQGRIKGQGELANGICPNEIKEIGNSSKNLTEGGRGEEELRNFLTEWGNQRNEGHTEQRSVPTPVLFADPSTSLTPVWGTQPFLRALLLSKLKIHLGWQPGGHLVMAPWALLPQFPSGYSNWGPSLADLHLVMWARALEGAEFWIMVGYPKTTPRARWFTTVVYSQMLDPLVRKGIRLQVYPENNEHEGVNSNTLLNLAQRSYVPNCPVD